MTFLIESLIACAVFTLFVFLMSRDPVKMVFNYPPAIVERCKSLGLVDESNRPGGTVFYIKKITAMAIFGILLGLLVPHQGRPYRHAAGHPSRAGCRTHYNYLKSYIFLCVRLFKEFPQHPLLLTEP